MAGSGDTSIGRQGGEPRCGTNINVRRVSWVRGWSCRWCAFENWRRQIEHDGARLIAEAERITKDAA